MENSSSSRHFLNYVIAAFLGVIAIAILNIALISPWFKNIKAEITQQPFARTVTVSAEGKISSKPDIAYVTFAVVSEKNSVKQVTQEANSKIALATSAVKKLGVEEKDITTSSYSLEPRYSYPENRIPQLQGYSLRQEVSLKIHKLELVDDVLDSVTKTGANEIGQLRFDIDDTSPLKKEAREKAFAAAKEKAQQMANAAGVKLGRVITFSESFDHYPIYAPNFAYEKSAVGRGGLMDASLPSIEPGSKELNVNVSVTYEIE